MAPPPTSPGRAPTPPAAWRRRQESKLLTRRAGFLLVRGRKRALACGDGQESRVELHKSGVHGGVRGVTGIAIRGEWDYFAWLAFVIVKPEESPLAGKARLVLDMRFQPHDFGALVIAFLVD